MKLNSPITLKVIESSILLQYKNTNFNGFTNKFYKKFKEKIISTVYRTLSKRWGEWNTSKFSLCIQKNSDSTTRQKLQGITNQFPFIINNP